MQRAKKNYVGMLEIFHAQITRITNSEALRNKLRHSGQPGGDVKIDNAGVSLGTQIVQVPAVYTRNRVGFCKVVPVDIIIEANGMPGKVLQNSKTAVGGYDQGFAIRTEDLRP